MRDDTEKRLRELVSRKFLFALDVIQSIHSEAQVNFDMEEFVIPLMPSEIRYGLLTIDAPNTRDDFCRGRYQAIDYLKKLGIIDDYEVHKAVIRWEARVVIQAKPEEIDAAFELFKTVYRDRLPNKDTQVEDAEEFKKEGAIKLDDFTYDEDTSCVTFRGLTSIIASNTLEESIVRYFLLDGNHKDGGWCSWDEVYEYYAGSDDFNKKHKSVSDAVRRINDKTSGDIGLMIFEYKNKKLRLNPRMF